VKGAVGFNAQRGDTIDIVNASFIPMPQAEVIPEPSLLQQPWVWDVAKQVAGGLGFLIVVFGVLKPVMCSLAAQGAQSMPAAAVPASVSAVAGGAGPATQDHPTLSAEDTQHTPSASPQLSYQQQLDAARGVVSEDPKRVAQVVKNWVGEDG
jgi:flagellar M-ring protein FliF